MASGHRAAENARGGRACCLHHGPPDRRPQAATLLTGRAQSCMPSQRMPGRTCVRVVVRVPNGTCPRRHARGLRGLPPRHAAGPCSPLAARRPLQPVSLRGCQCLRFYRPLRDSDTHWKRRAKLPIGAASGALTRLTTHLPQPNSCKNMRKYQHRHPKRQDGHGGLESQSTASVSLMRGA